MAESRSDRPTPHEATADHATTHHATAHDPPRDDTAPVAHPHDRRPGEGNGDDPSGVSALAARVDPGGSHLDRLATALARRADAAGLVDIAHRTVDSPVGPLLLAATPAGLVRIAFAREGHDQVLADLAQRISPRVVAAPAPLDDVVRQLDDWFAGRRHGFEVALDWQLSRGFRRRVLRRLLDIGWGRTATYGEVAALAANPGAARAVGSACASNPIPIVVPCHRVVRSDGSPGGYGGGPAAKAWLLAHEGGLAADHGPAAT